MPLWNLSSTVISHSSDSKVTLHWDNGTSTTLCTKDIHCAHCQKDMHGNPKEFVQYDGFCSPCFGTLTYGVPGTLTPERKHTFRWGRPVEQTSDMGGCVDSFFSMPARGADFLGNNFGVGDRVIHRVEPASQGEGVVLSLHQYFLEHDSFRRYGVFLAKTFFAREKEASAIPAYELEALTCKNIPFDTSPYEKVKMLEETLGTFDPLKNDTLRPVFEHPIARAIWIAYRLNHIVDDGDLARLAKTSLSIADKLDEHSPSRERLHLWFKKQFQEKMRHPMSHELVAYLVPYLAKEKEARYVVRSREAAA